MKYTEDLNKDKRTALLAAATFCSNGQTQDTMFLVANKMYNWLNPITVTNEQLGIQDEPDYNDDDEREVFGP